MANPILIPSATDPATTYQVTLGPRSAACECKDWQYRRAERGEECRHIRQARKEQAERLARIAGTVEDHELQPLIEKYCRQPGPVLLALLGEQFDREQLAKPPVEREPLPLLPLILARAQAFGRELLAVNAERQGSKSGMSEAERRHIFA